MNLNKKVTVLMPVYNAEKHLKDALESVLNQTYSDDYDVLVIDDGSTDNSASIIHKMGNSKIIYVKNEKNLGIIETLNRGLQMISGKYIIRMDSDDISLPNRIEKQVEFMDQNSNVAVSGTSVLKFNNKMKKKEKVAEDSMKIRTLLFFKNALKHPTVIIRNSVLKKNDYIYDINHKAMEDFGLWQKISIKHEIANLPKILLEYRINDEGITQKALKDTAALDNTYLHLYKQYFSMYELKLSEAELKLWRKFVSGRINTKDISSNESLAELIKKIKKNLKKFDFDINYFEEVVSNYYRINMLNQNISYVKSIDVHKTFFHDVFKYNIKEKIIYIIKSLT